MGIDPTASLTVADSVRQTGYVNEASVFEQVLNETRQQAQQGEADSLAGQKYAFDMSGGVKTDAPPSVKQVPHSAPKGTGPSVPQKNVFPSLPGIAAEYLEDRLARKTDITEHYGELELRAYPEGKTGPNGERAAFYHVQPDGSKVKLDVDVQINPLVTRHRHQPLKEVVTFDQDKLGKAFDLNKISPENRERLGLPEMAAGDKNPKEKPDANPSAPTEHQGHGFVTHTQEETDLVGSMKAQGKSQNEIQAALDNLRANKGGQTSNTIADRIQNALQSSNPEKRLEGEVAQKLIDSGVNVIGFNEKIGPNGSIGEIDIETDHAIIEITVAPARKLSQITKLSTNKDLNPHGKPVILYAPNYGITSGKDITGAGAYLTRNFNEFLPIVKKLEGK